MLEKLPKAEKSSISEGVAIIGMACVFPKAPDLQTFWQNIVSKVDAISDPPEDRDVNWVYDPESPANDRVYCKRGGYLQELPFFNPLDFGVMPAGIDGSEPEHFMALKVAHDALLDAGFPEKPFNRERTEIILGRGTFVNRGYITLLQHGLVVDQTIRLLGQLHPEYTPQDLSSIKQQLKESLPPFNAQTATGLAHSVMAGIIANRLDLKGPAVVVDAACASGLIALGNAVQDLISHKSDAAIIGGVQISTPAVIHMLFTQLDALSRHPQLRPFDKDADGTMLGEGIGMMVLKRKTDAIRDGHRIYAVIKGMGSASDGKAKGLLAPRVEGEELALRRAYEDTGINPGTIGLIEAHGTGLPLGDATEIQALKNVFDTDYSDQHRIALGTVKSMIGHLIPAAGIAGLIKTALALYHQILPPTLHCDNPHPEFDLEKAAFYINTESRPWIHASPKTPRRAGVNAFGFGGINTHAILEEFVSGHQDDPKQLHFIWDTEICLFQGHSRQDVIDRCKRLQHFLSQTGDATLRDIAFTLNNNTGRQRYCLSIVASSPEDLNEKISHAIERLQDPNRSRIKDRSGLYFFEKPLKPIGKLAFLFPGEGSQYVNMLSDLCLHFPEVRVCFDLLDRAFNDHPGHYLPSRFIFPETEKQRADAQERIYKMDGAVDSVTTANRALFRLYTQLGIQPDALLGHSSGEFMALEASGAVGIANEAELIDLIRAGNRVIEELKGARRMSQGALLAVGGLDSDTVHQFLNKYDGALHLAMDNCPHQFVLFGAERVISEAVSTLRKRGGICQILPFDRAYHTPLFEPALKPLRDFFKHLNIVSPQIPLYSCMTAGLYSQDPHQVRNLAVNQWARQVRFRETIETMYQDGVRIFLEIGPRANLTGFVNDILKRKNILAVASNVHHRSGITQLNHSLGLLAANGVSLSLEPLYKHRGARRLNFDEPETRPANQSHSSGLELSLALPMLSLKRSNAVLNQPKSAERAIAGLSEEEAPDSHLKYHQASSTVVTGQKRRPTDTVPTPSADFFQNSDMDSVPLSKDMNTTVIAEYFETMERFLDMQHDIMQSCLKGQDLTGHHKFASDLSHSGHDPGIAADRPDPKVAVASGSTAINSDRNTTATLQALSHTENRGTQDTSSADQHAAGIIDKDRLEQILLETVSEKTGYPEDMIDVNSNLEADLGIDSIKRVEILGQVLQQIGLIRDDAMEELNTLKTLREITGFLANNLPENSGRKTAVPTLEASGSGNKPNSTATTPTRSSTDAAELPFAGDIIQMVPDQEAHVNYEIDLGQNLFLQDHTLGGSVSRNDQSLFALPVFPLSMSLEMMATTAALLVPGKTLTGIQNVKAHSWILFEKPELVFNISVQALSKSDGTFAAQLRIQDNAANTGSPPVVEATMVFSDAYAAVPAAENIFLGADKVPVLPKEKFYPFALFHGPSFQSVIEGKQSGRNGIEVVLEIPPRERLFSHIADPQLLSDPVLIDAVGQAVGLWAGSYLEKNFVVFPISIQDISFFAPPMPSGARAECRVRTYLEGQNHIRSEVNVVKSDGTLQVKLKGVKHKRIHMPREFHLFRGSRDKMLSTPWTEPIEAFKTNEAIACCRMDKIPMEFWEADDHVWRSVLAHIVLSRSEREEWHNLSLTESGRTEWLLTRLVAKDAVRLFMTEYYELNLWPADIEIQTDTNGRFRVALNSSRDVKNGLHLSVAHFQGFFIAFVAEGDKIFGAGIEIQPIHSSCDSVVERYFSSDEYRAIVELDAPDKGEWIARVVAAKEALRRAVNVESFLSPLDVHVREVDSKKGTVTLGISDKFAHVRDESQWNLVKVNTLRNGDFITACALTGKGVCDG